MQYYVHSKIQVTVRSTYLLANENCFLNMCFYRLCFKWALAKSMKDGNSLTQFAQQIK